MIEGVDIQLYKYRNIRYVHLNAHVHIYILYILVHLYKATHLHFHVMHTRNIWILHVGIFLINAYPWHKRSYQYTNKALTEAISMYVYTLYSIQYCLTGREFSRSSLIDSSRVLTEYHHFLFPSFSSNF